MSGSQLGSWKMSCWRQHGFLVGGSWQGIHACLGHCYGGHKCSGFQLVPGFGAQANYPLQRTPAVTGQYERLLMLEFVREELEADRSLSDDSGILSGSRDDGFGDLACAQG